MNSRLSIEYIMGLINTDGSFYLDLKKDNSMPLKYALRPVIQISQQELDIHVLNKVKEMLDGENIANFINRTTGDNISKRSPRLKVEGISNVRQCFHLFDNSTAQFCGLKLLDYSLLKQMYELIDSKVHNSEKGRKKILDLKFHFHESPVLLPNLEANFKRRNLPERQFKEKPTANRYEREDWERLHGFEKDSTKETAKDLIDSSYQKYYEHCDQTLKGIKLQAEFVKGVLDGDGCIFQSSTTDVDFQITFDNGNEPLFIALADFFSDPNPCFYGRPGSQVYVIRKEKIVTEFKPLLQSLLTHKRKNML